MEEILRTQRELDLAWKATQTRESGRHCRVKDKIAAEETRRARAFEMQFLQGQLHQAVPFEALMTGNPKGIDTIIDFLEIDVPAFRCGYAKEYCFRKLKSCPLTDRQVQRRRNLAVTMCTGPYRQEVRELTRLMIRLADSQFVEELRRLSLQSENSFAVHRALRMLEIILQGRPDLRQLTPKLVKIPAKIDAMTEPENTPPTLGHGKICYIQIPAIDVHESAQFYHKVFGWNIRLRADGEIAFDDGVNEVSGTWVTGRWPLEASGLLIYIMVDDVASTLEVITRHGGEVVEGPAGTWPEVTALFRDPAGNVMGLGQQ